MSAFEKSESIKASLRQGFQDGSSKMAKRKCYGYTVGSDGQMVINSHEAIISDKTFMSVQEEKHRCLKAPVRTFAMNTIF